MTGVAATGGRSRRVLYVQYTNPAAYPPIEHGAGILADHGFDVTLVGLALEEDTMQLPPHARIVNRLQRIDRFRGLATYSRFTASAVSCALRDRPDWIYVSDTAATPAARALVAMCRARIVYHEHDTPGPVQSSESWFTRQSRRARRWIARRADACVVPNARRAEAFCREMARPDVLTVWNTPIRAEVAPARAGPLVGPLRALYHGSIVPRRLPLTVIDALADPAAAGMTLVFAGYETRGHGGYVTSLLERARARGVAGRVRYLGVVPTRRELLNHAVTCHVGLSLLMPAEGDPNEQAMVGASNKPFDYLSGGLALLVADLPDWRATFVTPGFARACTPADPRSLAEALGWFAAHGDETRAMGERGRQRVLDEWHYERGFAPLVSLMERGGRPA